MDAPAEDPAVLQLDWLLPQSSAEPVACLRRIRWMCEQVPDLPSLILLVGATHQGVPRARLATALHHCRAELAAMPEADVLSLLNGTLNGARDGFDSVLRSRKGAQRRTTAMPFLRPD